ncbi:MAG: hypothetical protein SPI65_05720 [Peptoniphilus sp.]|nr:hypothetical protein [Peptoniphilus sp.]MDD7362543.1 hypothetical protein [Bacillota bacterium]MDY6045058.1 hypothetical protein [Peptoniphilus sp.]
MKKAISYSLIAFQALIVVAVGVLNHLGSKKAGVQHHLQFKRTYYLHHLLTPGCRIALALAAILLACYFIYDMYKRKRASVMAVLGLVWSAALVASLLLPPMQEIMSYPYFILGLGINLLLSFIGEKVV